MTPFKADKTGEDGKMNNHELNYQLLFENRKVPEISEYNDGEEYCICTPAF